MKLTTETVTVALPYDVTSVSALLDVVNDPENACWIHIKAPRYTPIVDQSLLDDLERKDRLLRDELEKSIEDDMRELERQTNERVKLEVDKRLRSVKSELWPGIVIGLSVGAIAASLLIWLVR